MQLASQSREDQQLSRWFVHRLRTHLEIMKLILLQRAVATQHKRHTAGGQDGSAAHRTTSDPLGSELTGSAAQELPIRERLKVWVAENCPDGRPLTQSAPYDLSNSVRNTLSRIIATTLDREERLVGSASDEPGGLADDRDVAADAAVEVASKSPGDLVELRFAAPVEFFLSVTPDQSPEPLARGSRLSRSIWAFSEIDSTSSGPTGLGFSLQCTLRSSVFRILLPPLS